VIERGEIGVILDTYGLPAPARTCDGRLALELRSMRAPFSTAGAYGSTPRSP